MGFSPELLTDTILNLVGYLTAGGLLTLIYSALTNRHRRVRTSPAISAQTESRQSGSQAAKMAFVDLRTVGSEEHTTARPAKSATVNRDRQRNRAEVMRLAKEMLNNGTPHDNVRNLLPISEGELALLDNQRA